MKLPNFQTSMQCINNRYIQHLSALVTIRDAIIALKNSGWLVRTGKMKENERFSALYSLPNVIETEKDLLLKQVQEVKVEVLSFINSSFNEGVLARKYQDIQEYIEQLPKYANQ